MPSAEDALNAQLEAARAVPHSIVSDVLTEEQTEDLRVALGDVASDALDRVVHDGLSQEAATLLAHSVVELAHIRDVVLAV